MDKHHFRRLKSGLLCYYDLCEITSINSETRINHLTPYLKLHNHVVEAVIASTANKTTNMVFTYEIGQNKEIVNFIQIHLYFWQCNTVFAHNRVEYSVFMFV